MGYIVPPPPPRVLAQVPAKHDPHRFDPPGLLPGLPGESLGRPEPRWLVAFGRWWSHPRHRWETVEDTGVHRYQVCAVCKERRIVRVAVGHQPRDLVWLRTGEFRQWPNVVPAGIRSGASPPASPRTPPAPPFVSRMGMLEGDIAKDPPGLSGPAAPLPGESLGTRDPIDALLDAAFGALMHLVATPRLDGPLTADAIDGAGEEWPKLDPAR